MEFNPISGSSELIYSNGSLYLESIAKSDEGMYRCNITNGIGNSLVKSVMVKVIGNAQLLSKIT